MEQCMKRITACCILPAFVLFMPGRNVSALTQQQVTTQNLLARWYELGERVSYRMTGANTDRTGTIPYSATVSGIVKRDETGRFFEELEWSALNWNGMPVQIPSPNQQARQVLSLSLDRKPDMPDVSRIHPRLIGPAVDLVTFYTDAWAAMQQPALRSAGSRAVVFNHGDTTSWADGTRVVLGEDSTDLEIGLEEVNMAEGSATLTVLHVPPALPKIKTSAEWMRTPLKDAPNNWVQVVRAGARRFVASIGHETLEVQIQLSLTNGKIFSARMDNPVEVFERECTDEALTMCNEGIRYKILRHVAIAEGP